MSEPKLKEQIEASSWASVEGMDIPWMLGQWADRQPDKAALVWCPFEGDPRSIRYAELFERSRCLASGLSERGVRAGDFVLLHMDNSPEFVFSWYACAVLGAIAVSTNTRSVARDVSYFAEVTEAVCVLTQPKFAAMIREACPKLQFLAIADNDAGMDREDYKEVVEAVDGTPFAALFAEKPIALRPPDPTRNLSVQFTSGTTSRPKAVLWTHANGIWAGKSNAQHYRLRKEDIALAYMPLFHTNAQAYSMLATHWSGGTLVLQPKFSTSRFWPVCLAHRVTWASMIPFSVRALMEQPVPEHEMRFWSLGARIRAIEERFGVDTIGLWGMTETLTHGTVVDPDHLGPEMTMGRVAPGYEIQIRRPDGTLCGPDEPGHFYIRGVRGVSLFKEYYRNDKANASSFDQHGWFETGDIVRADEDGWLFFCDRDKDMLKVGAENVAASEIETVLMQTGLLSEAAVVGQRHYMLDEVPVAFVIASASGRDLGAEVLEAKLIEHCAVNLPDFKRVRSVHVVDTLPRATLEKIAKKELRDRLQPITEGA